ncbi:hypothetical protein SAMN05421780_1071 [Flexibacter flexilis DSM 6793]|uniref:Uncharacterized protein n=1 Tax=Flexibacter flexilis DSM 6793 TaxID=927664 RepID=A0A1I1KEE6_9BACT|nr:hypothetical protein [Flexibacter flexilis]SFC58652.1 hypothetical protein SAMN05421780_1071 [Flexibacter flexilis DSM 6793]
MRSIVRNFAQIISIIMLFVSAGFAQRGHGHDHGHGHGHGVHHDHHYHQPRRHVVVVERPRHHVVVHRHRSHYRPSRVVVYHPVWNPGYTFYRRWVFFPRYNLYWDNWRGMYVYPSGNVWISNPMLPPALININIQSEQHYELQENADDIDEIYDPMYDDYR